VEQTRKGAENSPSSIAEFQNDWSYTVALLYASIVCTRMSLPAEFYVLLTVHLDAILGNDQLDALSLNVFILCLYMFRAASAHHQERQIVLIHHLV
jgi:hypothetical protein